MSDRLVRMLWLFVASIAACGGDPPVIEPTMANVESQLFAISCNFPACHGSVSPQKGLDLTGKAHAKIVDVLSVEKPTSKLISPGKPDESYILDKVLGRDIPMAPMGERYDPMPPPSGGIEAERIELLRAWIAAGAKND